jgi:hypothetical protein
MTQMPKLLLVLFLALFLAGCPKPIVLKTLTLNATQVTSSNEWAYSQTWECSVPLPGQGLYLNGLGPEQANQGEANSGEDQIFNQGANPLPCNEQEDIIYRGQFSFVSQEPQLIPTDLTMFDSIVSATLNFGISRSTSNAQPQEPPVCVATVLGMSTGTKDEGSGPYYWDYDNDVPINAENPCVTLIPPQYSIGVSSQVRQWISGSHPDYGFIIAGPNLGEPNSGNANSNNGNVSFYNGFQLVILYNPALNPRAPQ